MIVHLLLILVALPNIGFAGSTPEYCLENRWIQSGEPKIIKESDKVFVRLGETLSVMTNDKKKVEFKNSEGLKYYAKGIDPSRNHAVVMIAGNEYGAYELINLKTGERLKTDGCPFWSDNGEYFVALNSDLEMRSSTNMATIYYCKNSYQKLIDLIQENERYSTGGKSADWEKNTVTISLIKEVPNGEPGETNEILKKCNLKGDKATCS